MAYAYKSISSPVGRLKLVASEQGPRRDPLGER